VRSARPTDAANHPQWMEEASRLCEEYVVSYYTSEGGYASTEDYFSASMVIAPYTMPKGAGVYSYGGGFPADTWNDSNYWIMSNFGR
jgi:hypothetical protein